MDVKLALSQMIGQSTVGTGSELFDLTERELVYKQKLCMEILDVANRLSPGRNQLISQCPSE